MYASHRLSGDHAIPRHDSKGSRSKCPVAIDRSRFDSTSSTRNSRPARMYQMLFPSGDQMGVLSGPAPIVRRVSVLVAKS